jgi:winged helix DNA-binding protein
MEPDDIAARRMRSQRVWGTAYRSIEEVFRGMGALQAQEFGVAGVSIAQRCRGLDRKAIMRAYDGGAILRTHALRPTWHFVSPADIRWIQALTGPRVHAMNAGRYRDLEIDGKLLARTTKLIAKALEGGSELTRAEIAAALSRAKIDAAGPRLAYIVMAAELDAVICSGAMRGKQFTYALLDERAPRAARQLDRDDALIELARRYFTTRGPATLADFSWWSSLTVTDGRSAVEALGDRLTFKEAGDRTYWFAPSGGRIARMRRPRVDLLQAYDELTVAYTKSRDVVTGHLADYTIPFGRALYLHNVFLDGRLDGHWKPVAAKAELVVEAWFYRRLTRAETEALDDAAERFGTYLGVEATVRIAGRPGR